MTFKDHFSTVSGGYAAFRPTYPNTLFDWIASVPTMTELAWDCACGTGQATLPLAAHFQRVVGTDASESQLKNAPRSLPNVSWRVAPAENSGFEPSSVDLVTVAQALHWFDLPAFYAEVSRVLRTGGALVVWCYGINRVEGEQVDNLVQDFYSNTVGPFWPPERKLVEDGYRTLPFPFESIEPPAFAMETAWNLEQLLGYLGTWSATSRFRQEKGFDPIDQLKAQLTPAWGAPDQLRKITWPLSLRAGRKT